VSNAGKSAATEEPMENLTVQLEAFLDSLMDRLDPGTAAILDRAQHRREVLDLPHRALQVGQQAPDFTLPDQHGKDVSLHEALSRGPVVLIFFRGGWCPFCTITLRAMNRAVSELKRAGAVLLAVSPQTKANSLDTAERNALRFPLLSDNANAVSKRYGLVWKLSEEQRAWYQRIGHDLPRINGAPGWELPVGAGFVIAPDGHVTVAHVDPRLTSRLEPEEALEAVKALQAQTAE
jgi:peroxiredoxin